MAITNEEILNEVKELRHETREGFDKLNGRVRENEKAIATQRECTTALRRDVDRLGIIDKVIAVVSAAVAGVAAFFVKQVGG